MRLTEKPQKTLKRSDFSGVGKTLLAPGLLATVSRPSAFRYASDESAHAWAP
jgi:hypothetical protein